MYDYGPMMHTDDNGEWGILVAISWILMLALVFYAVLRLLKYREDKPDANSEPIDIAKARYAKGEISKEQFEIMKKELAK